MAKAPINGDCLRWARELSNLGVDELASAAGTSARRVEEFEAGTSAPTFRQLALIASKLDRPMGFFFAEAPEVSDVAETADFRGRGDGHLPPSLVREMRRVEQHRDTVLDLSGPPRRGRDLGPVTWESLADRAGELRRRLGLTDTFVPPSSQANQAFNFWRGILETSGILVFHTTGIPFSTFRGLSIDHDELPVILLNGADSPNGRIFTLFHEIAHLANRTSGVCIHNEDVYEEALANRFSAAFLMPEAEVLRSVDPADDARAATDALAFRFRVSTLAAGVRLRQLGLIGEDDLADIRKKSDEAWERAREAQRDSDGFVPQWRLRYRDLGTPYIGTVATAIEQGRVDMMDATYLLNARVPMVEQMLEEYYRNGGRE